MCVSDWTRCSSFQRLQIGEQILQVVPGHWIRRHAAAGLDCLRIEIQPPEFPRCWAACRQRCGRLARCVRSGPTSRTGPVPRMVWHITQAWVRNTSCPCATCGFVGSGAGLAAGRVPGAEIFSRLSATI